MFALLSAIARSDLSADIQDGLSEAIPIIFADELMDFARLYELHELS
jgi:hypothetical protein